MHAFIPIYVLHRLEEYWGPDALEFNPDRWAEGKPKPMNGSYIPFGSGARQWYRFPSSSPPPKLLSE